MAGRISVRAGSARSCCWPCIAYNLELERTRDRLDGCIGCGCLSLETCANYNPDDRLARQETGPRQILAEPAPGETEAWAGAG